MIDFTCFPPSSSSVSPSVILSPALCTSPGSIPASCTVCYLPSSCRRPMLRPLPSSHSPSPDPHFYRPGGQAHVSWLADTQPEYSQTGVSSLSLPLPVQAPTPAPSCSYRVEAGPLFLPTPSTLPGSFLDSTPASSWHHPFLPLPPPQVGSLPSLFWSLFQEHAGPPCLLPEFYSENSSSCPQLSRVRLGRGLPFFLCFASAV